MGLFAPCMSSPGKYSSLFPVFTGFFFFLSFEHSLYFLGAVFCQIHFRLQVFSPSLYFHPLNRILSEQKLLLLMSFNLSVCPLMDHGFAIKSRLPTGAPGTPGVGLSLGQPGRQFWLLSGLC